MASGGVAPATTEASQSRDFVSVHDVARAVVLALDSEAANGEVFNIASGVARPIGECAQLLARRLGLDIAPTISGRFRSGDIRHCTADIARAREGLGYEPSTSWEAGLAELAQWARSAPFADHFERAQREIERRGLVS